MSPFDHFLWVIVPYIAISVFVVGHVWRYRYDKFGWTTRSSQLYERRLLRWGSPLFHFGILAALGGHVLGILVPESWTSAVGIDETAYHVVSVALGTVAGVCTVVGLAILIYRRRTVGPVFSATTRNDKAMYLVLAFVILNGIGATIWYNLIGEAGAAAANYRESVAPWFRSVFVLQPRGELMVSAEPLFQLHALAAWALFAMWPFTRLVHVFSAPVGYLFRPYVVYRSRAPRAGLRPARRGWERVGS